MYGTCTKGRDNISILKGIAMTIRQLRIPVKVFTMLLSVACFLAFNLAAVSPVLAADPAAPPAKGSSWETWPKQPGGAAGTAGATGGEATSEGINWGTWGWVLGGLAAVGLIALAAGGGGGGSTSPPVCAQ
jgi:hypothetical protein